MEMKFNSQICTTKEQSERLLALGLKKETADMCWINGNILYCEPPELTNDIPAWSLHRLWELAQISLLKLEYRGEIVKLYDLVIDNIELQINQGYFNKEYLV